MLTQLDFVGTPTVETLETRTLLSVNPVLVADLVVGAGGSNLSNFVNVNGTLFFNATNNSNGIELWKSDGTSAGTTLVKDIFAGSSSSYPRSLVNVNGTLFFRADDGVNGTELWKSDGTSVGTTLIKDIISGPGNSVPSSLTNVNGKLFFSANDGVNGAELWKSDGTSAGTTLVKDIRSGIDGSSPAALTNVNGTLFFVASDGVNGFELWQSDGTSAGTTLVKDILSGVGNSSPAALTNVNGTLFFCARDGVNGLELWQSDGTSAGTTLVKDIRTGSSDSFPNSLTNVNGTLFFNANDGTSGYELWRSDGTSAGTTLVKDIRSGIDISNPGSLTNVNGTLFFRANDGVNGLELWQSDGTSAGTTLVNDIFTGSSSSFSDYLTNVNGKLFFRATDGVNGFELWKADVPADTPKVAVHTFSFLPPAIVKNIASGSNSSATSRFVNLNGTLFFQANDVTNGAELWKSDGTSAGTTIVKDIATGSGSSNPLFLTNVNGTLFFTATDTVNGTELWQSDGTSAGTTFVKDIVTGSSGSYPQNLTNVNGTLFFSAFDGVNGFELWKSDGTSAGTTLVKDIAIGGDNSLPEFLTNVNGTLFFTAKDAVNGYELWQSDGTSAGTTLVKDIRNGNNGSFPSHLANVNGTLYFRANDAVTGYELWQSDGTASGTTLVKDAVPGIGGLSPQLLTNVNGTLFFRANDGTNGDELWQSDGTSAGTTLVKDIRSGSIGSIPRNLANVNGTLFFSANDGVNGDELWQSDGTSTGTTLVKDIATGSGSSGPRYLMNVNGTLFFSANDGVNGFELWSMPVNSRPRLTAFAAVLNTTNEDTEVELTYGDLLDQGDESDADGIVDAFVVQAVSSGTLKIGMDAGSAAPFAVGSNDIIDPTLHAYWTPAANAYGNAIAAFTVLAQDDLGLTSILPITASVDVSAVADTPSITNAATDEDVQSSSGLVISRNVVDGAEVTHFKITSISGGSLFQNDGTTAISNNEFITFAQADAGLKFTPTLNSNVTGHFTVQASLSNVNGGLGGSTVTADITVNPVNDPASALQLSRTSANLAEDASTASATTLATITVTDDALGTNVLSLTGTDAASFEIVSGQLRLKSGVALNFESQQTYTVNVEVDDASVGGNPDASATFTLNITDVNEAPTAVTFTNTTTSLAENSSTATAVKLADIAVTDDALGTIVLSLSGTDAALFEIVSDELRLVAGTVLDFEAKSSYDVTVEVNDSAVGGAVDASQSFTLTVTDVNEAPTAVTFTNTTTSLAENTSTATAVKLADISVTDDALGTNARSLSGTDAAFFEIVGTELRLKAGTVLNFEAKSSYDVTVEVNDSAVGGAIDASQSFILTVTDVNEAPTTVAFTNTTTSLAENTSTTTAIKLADISVTDDALGTNALSLSGTDAAFFEIVSNELRLVAGTVLDFETKSSYDVTVEVNDSAVGGAVDASQSLTLTVTDVNEAPTAVTFTNTTTSLAENSSTATAIKLADISVTDDALGTNALSLSGTDAAFFEIVGNELRLVSGTVLDFEAKSSYDVTVEVNDSAVGGAVDASQSFTLTITDVNEAPTAVTFTNTTTSLAENSSTATAIKLADISVTDDALGTNALSLSGTDAAFFEIVGNELRLDAGTVLDFEAKSSYDVTVEVNDAAVGGTVDASQGFTLTLTNVLDTTSSIDTFVVTYSLSDVTITHAINGGVATSLGSFPLNVPITLDGLSADDAVRIIGTSGDDLFLANNSGLTINGSELILNGLASRTLIGALGNDTYSFDADDVLGHFTLDESVGGVDTIGFATTAVNVVLSLASASTQTVHATNLSLNLGSSTTFENILGGQGNDTLTGNGRNNTLHGGPGNDRINGGVGSDILIGGADNDTYIFGIAVPGEADQIQELLNEGTDTINFAPQTNSVSLNLWDTQIQNVHTNRTLQLSSGRTIENVIGGAGADRITGNRLNNTLTGGAGHDTLNGSTGDDILSGGQGNDTYFFSEAVDPEADRINESVDQGTDTLRFASLTVDVVANLGTSLVQNVHTNRTLKLNSASTLENAVGGSGADTLIGNALTNRLSGENGNNILVGRDGADFLLGGPGRDLLIGGLGADTMNGGNGDDIVIAGRTTIDTSIARLNTIRTEWMSSNSYEDRIANLRAGVGSPVVSLKATINVLNDANEIDTLTGGTGFDWYFRAVDDVITDLFAGAVVDLL